MKLFTPLFLLLLSLVSSFGQTRTVNTLPGSSRLVPGLADFFPVNVDLVQGSLAGKGLTNITLLNPLNWTMRLGTVGSSTPLMSLGAQNGIFSISNNNLGVTAAYYDYTANNWNFQPQANFYNDVNIGFGNLFVGGNINASLGTLDIGTMRFGGLSSATALFSKTNGVGYGTDDNGDGYAFQFIDTVSGRLRAAIRMVDDISAEHGRFTAAGQNKSAVYTNWNCGRFEAINLRSPGADKRLAMINMRGKDFSADCSGRMDFFTRNGPRSQFYVGLRLDEFGRVAIGSANGYPTPTVEVEPTAWLMLAPGTNTPFGAPLKFNLSGLTTIGTAITPQLLTTPENGAMECDGTHLYMTLGGVRYQLDQQAGSAGPLDKFNVDQFATNSTAGMWYIQPTAKMTNIVARQGNNGWAAVHIVSTNIGASLTTNEFGLTIQGDQAELGLLSAAGNVMGCLRGDVTGVFNYHSTNAHAFYTQTNQATGNAALLLRGGRAFMGPFGSIFTPKEQLEISGSLKVTNGYVRIWTVTSPPTASNSQAQVYSRTPSANAELFAMNSAGQETQLTGNQQTNLLSAVSVQDFASTAAGSESDSAGITVTGALDGDPVVLGVPAAGWAAGAQWTGYVSATDTVKIRYRNNSAGAIDPPSLTIKIEVHKLK